MKSLAMRAAGGMISASILLAAPAAANAGPPNDPESVRPLPVPTAGAYPPGVSGMGDRPAATVTRKHKKPKKAATKPAGRGAGEVVLESAVVAKNLSFRVAVPGASATGIYATGKAPAEIRRGVKGKGSPALTVELEVTEQTRCGVLQMTTNGPADGVEWHTFAALCKPGTTTIRTQATRLPWSTGTLPSIRLCNGLRPALAEGDDCDTFEPPRGS
ncbi:MAG TPA: hypothetical protein VN408_30790 [Actinoplanes sp.]|nr:hypothetical protein [Actinoplanes sp.]